MYLNFHLVQLMFLADYTKFKFTIFCTIFILNLVIIKKREHQEVNSLEDFSLLLQRCHWYMILGRKCAKAGSFQLSRRCLNVFVISRSQGGNWGFIPSPSCWKNSFCWLTWKKNHTHIQTSSNVLVHPHFGTLHPILVSLKSTAFPSRSFSA